MFHSFFFFQFFKVRGIYPFFFFFRFLLTLLCGHPIQQCPQFCRFSFLMIIINSRRLAEIRWFVCTWKSQRNFCILFSRTVSRLCICHLLLWLYLNVLHNSQWITLPTQSCLVLHFFCANLLQSLITWLITSSLLSYNMMCCFFFCVVSVESAGLYWCPNDSNFFPALRDLLRILDDLIVLKSE